jgi:hypothetical protein
MYDTIENDLFSIGLTFLEASILESVQDIFEKKENNEILINFEKLQQKIDKLLPRYSLDYV